MRGRDTNALGTLTNFVLGLLRLSTAAAWRSALNVDAAGSGGAVSSVFGRTGAVTLTNAETDDSTLETSGGAARIKDGGVTLVKLAATIKPSGSAAAGDEAVRALGTSASTACAGNDARLSDARTPTDASVTVAKLAAAVKVLTLNFVIDGGGSVITTGVKGDIVIDFDFTINQVTLLADQSGSIVIDLWKDTYANFPPTVADTITAAAKPTISAATKSQDATLTGWNVTGNAGDIIRVNVDSISTCTRVLVSLKVSRR